MSGPSARAGKLWIGGAGVAGGTVLGQAATAVLYLLAARFAGPNSFGKTFALISLALLLVDFVDFGVVAFDTRQLAVSPSHDWRANLRSKFAVAYIATIGWAGVAMFLGEPLQALAPALVLLGHLSVTSLYPPNRAASAYGRLARAAALERIAALVVFLGISRLQVDVAVGLPAAMCAGEMFAVWLLGGTREILSAAFRATLAGTPRRVSRARHFGLTNLATDSAQLQINLIAIIAGATAAGYYSATSRMAGALNTGTNALSTLLLPTFAQHSAARAKVILRTAITATGVITGCGALLLVFGGKTLISAVLGDAYLPAATALKVLALAALVSSVLQPIQVFLQGIGRERWVTRISLASATWGCLFVATGAALGGVTGASIGALANTVCVLAAYLGLLQRTSKPTRVPEGPENEFAFPREASADCSRITSSSA